MLIWILFALTLHLVHIYLPAALFLPAEGLLNHGGSRDELPLPSRAVGRARRALANYQENLPIFLALAFLAYLVEGADMNGAIMGAKIFVLARAAYLPLYMISIPFTRSIAYTIGLVGNVLMLMAVL